MHRTRRLSRSWWNCCHSCKIAVLNSSIFWHFRLRWLIFLPIKSHTCSIEFMSTDIAGHGMVWTASCCKKCSTIRALCGLALSSMNIGPSANACRNGRLRVERTHCHGIFGLSDYHQKRTSPTYSQRKNNPRQLHPHPQKQLCPTCGCPEMKFSLAPNPCTTVGRA
jgi:hypothetical protein